MQRLRDDAAFLSNPEAWPMWPYCPVKREDGNAFPDTAVVAVTGDTFVLLHVNLFGTPAEYANAKKESFASAQAIVDAGWRVD